jgi:hypothetical protein
MFGKYSGMVIAKDGEQIGIKELTGWCEEHKAKW